TSMRAASSSSIEAGGTGSFDQRSARIAGDAAGSAMSIPLHDAALDDLVIDLVTQPRSGGREHVTVDDSHGLGQSVVEEIEAVGASRIRGEQLVELGVRQRHRDV